MKTPATVKESARVIPQKPEDSAEEGTDETDKQEKQVPVKPEIDRRPVKFLKATLVSVDCSQTPSAVLAISQGNKVLKLRAADYKSVAVIGAGEFSCSWKNIPVNINYRAGGKQDGDLVSIEVQ